MWDALHMKASTNTHTHALPVWLMVVAVEMVFCQYSHTRRSVELDIGAYDKIGDWLSVLRLQTEI